MTDVGERLATAVASLACHKVTQWTWTTSNGSRRRCACKVHASLTTRLAIGTRPSGPVCVPRGTTRTANWR